jgi:hypothetical protein
MNCQPIDDLYRQTPQALAILWPRFREPLGNLSFSGTADTRSHQQLPQTFDPRSLTLTGSKRSCDEFPNGSAKRRLRLGREGWPSAL